MRLKAHVSLPSGRLDMGRGAGGVSEWVADSALPWTMEGIMGTRKIGRDAKTGEFIPVKEAQRRPTTTVVETIKTKPTPKPTKK